MPRLWRKKSQGTRKLIDGSSPQKTPRCRASADVDALCGGSVGALTMMQLRIPNVEGLRGSFHTFSSNVCPGFFRPADIDYTRAIRISPMLMDILG